MAERFRQRAISASPGIAVGPAYLAAQPTAEFAAGQQATSGHEVLAGAVQTAIGELQRLAEGADPESHDIIDFQIEVLRDPTIAATTTARVKAGENVVFAWVGTLDGYITELEGADEEQMRARAVDIQDIKNRVLGALTGKPIKDFPAGSVFVGSDMEPSRFLAHDWSAGGGIVLHKGSAVGHVALLARSRSVPMVVGAGDFTVAEGAPITVEGDAGMVFLPTGNTVMRMVPRPAARRHDHTEPSDNGMLNTADGKPVLLSVNLNDPSEVDAVSIRAIAGVGLMRTEFAISSIADAANEEKQLSIYRRVLEWADGKSVAIRMLDVGGDKPLSGLEDVHAELRGIRLLLERPEIARVQARALLRAAVFGKLAVLLPMVTFPGEVEAMRRIFQEEAAQLDRRGLPYCMPPIGMMVEVPAAAVMLDTFATADFFSFGTNDLAQYLAASTRRAVTADSRKTSPAVLRILANAARLASTKPMSICGDMAGDPQYLSALLAAGIRHFSMAPARLPAIRSALIGLNADGTTAAGE
ncbi:putative PEP-binding protein [Rhizobium sp. S96]|uniref:putative PEP-binding protein n=1 Tax=Rhizobium sp. S96 TaxID=3055140 RepID=UPI0025AB3FF9|nr:putative PEP-binding protein [Rhizobium sp. S96]MDM9623892.1 phosphoenolpyruvate-utilizing N-terminal domain-containing protein [Rhizobium sp. S96]